MNQEQVSEKSFPSAFESDPLIKKFGGFLTLTDDEIAYLNSLRKNQSSFEPNAEIQSEGESPQHIHILRHGWAVRYKLLSDGRRQILNFALPGDCIGITANLFQAADHSVAALTTVTSDNFPSKNLLSLCQAHPRVALAFNWATAREQTILAAHTVRLGRRSAAEAMGHLFLELLKRLQLVGLANKHSYELPITQEILADLLGLSIVHVNRTLRRLRQRGLIELDLKNRRLIIKDIHRLAKAVDFDPTYLGQERKPVKGKKQLLGES